MLKKYNLKMPRIIFSGENPLENIKTIIDQGVEKVAVFTDEGVVGAGLLEGLLALIKRDWCRNSHYRSTTNGANV